MFSGLRDRLTAAGATLFPNPRFYGWAIVGLSFLACALSSPGQSFAISLYIEHLIEDLDATRLEVSSLYGVMTLLAALCLPVIGRIADGVRGKTFLCVNLALLAVAVAFFGGVQSLVMLAIAFFLLRLLGQGAIGLGTLTVTVLWFRRFRGRALSVGQLGYAFGELIFPAIIVGLIAWVGWRESLWVIAAVYLVVFVPLYALLIRRRRDDEPIDGDVVPHPDDGEECQASGSEVAPASGGEPEAAREISFELKEALQTPVFWGVLTSVAVLPLVITAVIFHQVALFDSVGWGAQYVPISFVFFALTSVACTYATGLVVERVPTRFAITVGMSCTVAAMVVAGWGGASVVGSLIYGTLLGASAGILTAANSLIWPEYYGVESIGAIKGVVKAVRNGSTALGPPLVAWLIGPEEIFMSAFWILGTMSVAAAVLALWMKPPQKPAR